MFLFHTNLYLIITNKPLLVVRHQGKYHIQLWVI
uniref:Uncharacterized protein n=1 Tax=Anguilla anguilla TaxID=7936 RepID=A0A0E9RBZ6_ANGAN